jgi:hypothetical protein
MTSRKSSGSSRAESAVEPTRSQNITVSCRRSAPSARRGAGTAAGAGAATSPIGLPQPPQNLAAGSFSKPQAGQGDGNGAPHSAQKRLAAAFSAVQLGQRIWCPEGEPILLQDNSSAIALEAKGSPGPDELVQGPGATRGRSGFWR